MQKLLDKGKEALEKRLGGDSQQEHHPAQPGGGGGPGGHHGGGPHPQGYPGHPKGNSNADSGHQAGSRPSCPQPGQHEGPGRMPPRVKNVEYHNDMRFYHPAGHKHKVLCDLGYSGVLDGKIVWLFGDTLMGDEKQHMICATDSVAIGHMNDKMAVTNTALWPNNDNVKEFIPCNEEEKKHGGISVFAFGGTNIVEVAPGKGVVYYLKIHRPGGKPNIKGAGVAKVHLEKGDIPKAVRCGEKMWNKDEPAWGDVGIALNEKDGHLYVFGHGPPGHKELGVRTWLCKVPKDKFDDINAYEYWDNAHRSWGKQRYTIEGEGDTKKLEHNTAIFNWMVMNQSAPFWSNYFNKWMLLYGSCWGSSHVLCMMADHLEGPWKYHDVVAKTDPPEGQTGLRYCHNGHPEFDPTGKTVLATWTRNNRIKGCTIEWE